MLDLSPLHSIFRYKDKTRSTSWKVAESSTGETSSTNHFLINEKTLKFVFAKSTNWAEQSKLCTPYYIFLKMFLTQNQMQAIDVLEVKSFLNWKGKSKYTEHVFRVRLPQRLFRKGYIPMECIKSIFRWDIILINNLI